MLRILLFVLLFSTMQVSAQNLINISGGPTIPMGSYQTHHSDLEKFGYAKPGYNISIDQISYLSDSTLGPGIKITFSYAQNPMNTKAYATNAKFNTRDFNQEWEVTATPYRHYQFMFGVNCGFKAKAVSFNLHTTMGVVGTDLPHIRAVGNGANNSVFKREIGPSSSVTFAFSGGFKMAYKLGEVTRLTFSTNYHTAKQSFEDVPFRERTLNNNSSNGNQEIKRAYKYEVPVSYMRFNLGVGFFL